jgi:hypothetical protein
MATMPCGTLQDEHTYRAYITVQSINLCKQLQWRPACRIASPSCFHSLRTCLPVMPMLKELWLCWVLQLCLSSSYKTGGPAFF